MNQSLTRTVVSTFGHNNVPALESKSGETLTVISAQGTPQEGKSMLKSLLHNACREIVQPFYLRINSKFDRLSARLKNYREIV
jgi:hypothetical protein